MEVIYRRNNRKTSAEKKNTERILHPQESRIFPFFSHKWICIRVTLKIMLSDGKRKNLQATEDLALQKNKNKVTRNV